MFDHSTSPPFPTAASKACHQVPSSRVVYIHFKNGATILHHTESFSCEKFPSGCLVSCSDTPISNVLTEHPKTSPRAHLGVSLPRLMAFPQRVQNCNSRLIPNRFGYLPCFASGTLFKQVGRSSPKPSHERRFGSATPRPVLLVSLLSLLIENRYKSSVCARVAARAILPDHRTRAQWFFVQPQSRFPSLARYCYFPFSIAPDQISSFLPWVTPVAWTSSQLLRFIEPQRLRSCPRRSGDQARSALLLVGCPLLIDTLPPPVTHMTVAIFLHVFCS